MFAFTKEYFMYLQVVVVSYMLYSVVAQVQVAPLMRKLLMRGTNTKKDIWIKTNLYKSIN